MPKPRPVRSKRGGGRQVWRIRADALNRKVTTDDGKLVASGEMMLSAPAPHRPLARPLCRASKLLLVAFRDGANLSERAVHRLCTCAEKPQAEATYPCDPQDDVSRRTLARASLDPSCSAVARLVESKGCIEWVARSGI